MVQILNAAVIWAVTLGISSLGAPSAVARGDSEGGAGPIDFAVVVDASPSVEADALQGEKEAAALLAQGEISRDSRGMVLIFGGADDSGYTSVDEACPLTKLDAAGRQSLGDCVKRLNRESAKIGAGTDFPSAIRQAANRLSADSSPGTPKIMFLLTDGKLDVRDDPAYGPDPPTREANGEKALTGALRQARSAGVQVWPLGFGKDVEKEALQTMASGAYQNACAGLPEATPHARTVTSPSDVDTALLQTFASARCAHLTEGTSRRPSSDLHVELPPIATNAAIVVIKHDPEVNVSYIDPGGTKIPRDGENSAFQVSGLQNTVAGLQILQPPAPGEWTAHVDAPPGHRDQTATIGAIWQGVVRSYIDVQRGVEQGEKIPVEVQLQNQQGVPVIDLLQAYGGRVGVRLAGQSIQPNGFQLEDKGREPDSKSGDGRFSGYVDIPRNAKGKLTLTSTVVAPGITGDSRPVTLDVDPPPTGVTAAGVVDQQTVQPGGTVSGIVETANKDSKPHELRLILQDTNKAVPASISPVIVSVPAGSAQQSHKFAISVSDRAAKDQMLGGHVTVLDSTDGNKQLATVFVGTTVKPPPSTPWNLIGALCAAGVLLILFLWDRYRRWLNPAGLQLALYDKDKGEVLSTSQPVQHGQKGPYSFSVDENEIKPGRGEKGAYQIHRWLPKGRLKVKTASGKKQEVHEGQPFGIGNKSIVPSYRSRMHPIHPRGNSGGSKSGTADYF
ncbi:VWA domain-containing protein [Streptomyces sp. HUAS ZL42]|uniref:vWA domain-containing protein n=1 Tax=Streptomyces sp. HUAS ZL42 TaxID=3231715 RepID=UPI00345EC8B9